MTPFTIDLEVGTQTKDPPEHALDAIEYIRALLEDLLKDTASVQVEYHASSGKILISALSPQGIGHNAFLDVPGNMHRAVFEVRGRLRAFARKFKRQFPPESVKAKFIPTIL